MFVCKGQTAKGPFFNTTNSGSTWQQKLYSCLYVKLTHCAKVSRNEQGNHSDIASFVSNCMIPYKSFKVIYYYYFWFFLVHKDYCTKGGETLFFGVTSQISSTSSHTPKHPLNFKHLKIPSSTLKQVIQKSGQTIIVFYFRHVL